MRDNQPNKNHLYLSAGKREAKTNQEAKPDTLFLVELGNLITYARRPLDLPIQAGGPSEPDKLMYAENQVGLPVEWPQMQPQHLALLAAFGLGSITTTVNGGDGAANGYRHVIKPLEDPGALDDILPCLTAVQRVGETLEHRLAAGMVVDSLDLSAQTGQDFLKLTGQLKGTGKTDSSLTMEEIAGTDGDTDVTLGLAVAGDDAAGRLDSVQKVLFKLDSGGGWQEVHCSAVSDAAGAELTITAPTDGGAAAGTYRVYYLSQADQELATGSATSDPAYDAVSGECALADSAGAMTPGEMAGRWLVMTSGTANGEFFRITDNAADGFTLAADLYAAGVRSLDTYKVVPLAWVEAVGSLAKVAEPYLKLTDVEVVVGGAYDGSAISGGWRLGSGLNSLNWNWANNTEQTIRGGDGDYCSGHDRSDYRTQTLKIDRRTRDAVSRAILAHGGGDSGGDADEPQYFAIQAAAWGPVMGGGYRYGIRITWPRLGIKTVELAAEKTRTNEAQEVAVLTDETHGSVVVEVFNKVAAYAA